MFSILIDLVLGFLIGLSLGFLGGGGSILTVPALVYIVGQSPQAAVTASLMIVGANASMGAFFHRAQGTLNWRVALVFGGVGMVAAYLSAGLSKLLPPTVLMILFALLMIAVGLLMILSKPPLEQDEKGRSWWVTVVSGAGVGVLTGFLGVGGGFLIVPALVMLVGLPIRQAVGTSLVVIAMNSLAGVLGHLDSGPVDLVTVVLFAGAGIAGSLAGARLARVIKPAQLRTSFALFVVALALFLLYDNVGKLLASSEKLAVMFVNLQGTFFNGVTVNIPAALVGGVLIGLSATILLAVNGRIAGVSGIVHGALNPQRGEAFWRWLFLAGIVTGAGIYEWWLALTPTPTSTFAPAAMIIGGLLVGIGTRMSNGCTSGHGVCGLGRLSPRSAIAVVTFLGTAAMTVFVLRQVLGFAL